MAAKTPNLWEAYSATLDRAQAYEVLSKCDDVNNRNELNMELYTMHLSFCNCNDHDVENSILKINKMLDEFINESKSVRSAEVQHFLMNRRPGTNIDDTVLGMLNQEIKRLTVFVTALQNKGNVSVADAVTSEQYTEDGKLIKEKICSVCDSKFNSNRVDAQYCSTKCKQAAYRERKKK